MKKLGGLAVLVFLAGCATAPLPPLPPPPPPPPPPVTAAPIEVPAERAEHAPVTSADVAVSGSQTGTSAHLVLAVDWQAMHRKLLDDFAIGLGPVVDARRIAYALSVRNGAILISIPDKSQTAAARKLLVELCTPADGEPVKYDLSDAAGGSYAITPDPAYLRTFKHELMRETVDALVHRLDTFASAPAHVGVDASGKFVVDVSGFTDRETLMRLFGPPARLEFHAVDENITGADIAAGHVPAGDVVLDEDLEGPAATPIAISRTILLSGDHVVDVRNAVSLDTGQSVIGIDFEDRKSVV